MGVACASCEEEVLRLAPGIEVAAITVRSGRLITQRLFIPGRGATGRESDHENHGEEQASNDAVQTIPSESFLSPLGPRTTPACYPKC